MSWIKRHCAAITSIRYLVSEDRQLTRLGTIFPEYVAGCNCCVGGTKGGMGYAGVLRSRGLLASGANTLGI